MVEIISNYQSNRRDDISLPAGFVFCSQLLGFTVPVWLPLARQSSDYQHLISPALTWELTWLSVLVIDVSTSTMLPITASDAPHSSTQLHTAPIIVGQSGLIKQRGGEVRGGLIILIWRALPTKH